MLTLYELQGRGVTEQFVFSPLSPVASSKGLGRHTDPLKIDKTILKI